MTAKFPTETTSTDTSTTGNYTCEGDVAISSKSGTDITNKIQIIADNMYIEGKTNLDEFLKDVFVDEFGQLEDPDYIFYGKTEEELLSEIKAAINVNDIFFAQQLAIWNYTVYQLIILMTKVIIGMELQITVLLKKKIKLKKLEII